MEEGMTPRDVKEFVEVATFIGIAVASFGVVAGAFKWIAVAGIY